MVAREVGGDVAPGAVRFGEAVEEDDGRVGGIAADRDVEVDALDDLKGAETLANVGKANIGPGLNLS